MTLHIKHSERVVSLQQMSPTAKLFLFFFLQAVVICERLLFVFHITIWVTGIWMDIAHKTLSESGQFTTDVTAKLFAFFFAQAVVICERLLLVCFSYYLLADRDMVWTLQSVT